MQILNIQSFTGKNIYSYKPVIKMVVDVGHLYEKPTKEIEGFNKGLLELFPGLIEHNCSLGHRGGFVERLEEGTYIPHVIEHVILELQNIIGDEVYYGRARVIGEPSLYTIIFEYKTERCAIECGKTGTTIVADLANNIKIDFDKQIENIHKIKMQCELGPSTRAIVDEAIRRNIPVTRIGEDSLIQIGYGKYSRRIQASLTDKPNCIAVDIAGNKHLTKQVLREYQIPVPYGDVVYSEEAAIICAKTIGFPVVVKPLDGNQGKGVALNLNNEEQVRQAYHEALKFGKSVIVEQHIKGKDYRILVVGDKVSAVAERIPPIIMGDGIHTIQELVEVQNGNHLRGEDHEKPLTKIKLDNIVKQVLSKKGMNENSVPAKEEAIYLRENGNLSTGGIARDCTSEIHHENSKAAIDAARMIGLDIAGIDMTIEDISKPISYTNGAIIEVNAAPGLRMHLYPTHGEPRNVAADILDMMFPKSQANSIPIVSITGTNGKTTTTRLISYVLTLTGKKVGMTSTSGIYINNECILKGDNTGPISARIVLSNQNVEAAVLETARGGILRKGLGYDAADIGVITNISEDHLGIDGLNTLEDLAFVKSLVIETVKSDGYAVLNADDEMIHYLLKRAKTKTILFSKNVRNSLMIEHMNAGEKGVYIKKGVIYIHDDKEIIPLLKIRELPITFNGLLECNVENTLAAVSALYALGTPIDVIRNGLKTFMPDLTTNPGRFNLFDMGGFKVMLDYSHNLAGYNAVIKFIRKMNANRIVGVIGMPGDRLDENIKEVGKVCSKAFSQIYIKEDGDLRGRKSGEVADILYNAVIKGGIKKEHVIIIHSELEALEAAISDAEPGDLIVMFYEKFEPAVELVNRLKNSIEQQDLQPPAPIRRTV